MPSATKRARGDGEDYSSFGSRGKKPKTATNGDAKDAVTPEKKPKKEEKYKRQKEERELKRQHKLAREAREGRAKPTEEAEKPAETEVEQQADEPAQVSDVEIEDAPEVAAAVADPELVSDKSDKKKDKKDKKKKDKKAKKEKVEEVEKPAEQQVEELVLVPEVVMEDAAVEADAEHVSEKKEKKEKNDKKEKKEKKEKKSKKSKTADETTPESAAEQNDASARGAKPTKGAAQRNGSTYAYKQAAALDTMSESDVEEFLKKAEINLSEPSATGFRPITHFSQIPSSKLISKKPFATFTAPTPIQSASWPYALSGRDVIGIAETGSGKTLAFSLPCIEALSSVQKATKSTARSTHVRAVIVAPTRELAMQTHAAIADLAALVGLSSVCIYGGASKDDQRSLLRKNGGADIVVATPGRLKDFLSDDTVSLSEVMFAVLDEADRMLDKGFEEDIKQILGCCPPREQRQTLMFTATWPTSVRGLAEGYMIDPIKVTIGARMRAGEEDSNGNGTIELQANIRIAQTVEVVDPRGKEQRLLELLKEAQKGSAKNDRILVFCLYKKEAVRVELFLERRGMNVCSIHGDLGQDQRTRSLAAFKAGTKSVLVATDVAARGLDIPEVKLVINLTVSGYIDSV